MNEQEAIARLKALFQANRAMVKPTGDGYQWQLKGQSIQLPKATFNRPTTTRFR